MSQLPTLPQEILDEILRTAIDLIIRTARVQIYNTQYRGAQAWRAARQILALRYFSRASAREVMSICWRRLQKILLNAERIISPAAHVEEWILEQCVRRWLRTCQDDDDELSTARRAMKDESRKLCTATHKFGEWWTLKLPAWRSCFKPRSIRFRYLWLPQDAPVFAEERELHDLAEGGLHDI